MFTEEFIKGLPDDPIRAGIEICKAFLQFVNTITTGTKRQYSDKYDAFLEAFAFAEIFIEANGIEIGVPDVNISSDRDFNCKVIIDFFQRWQGAATKEWEALNAKNALENARARYRHILGKGVIYEFSDEDFAKVQELVNRLREILTKSKDFEEEHRLRLLKKLETLQLELHKKMSNFDRFWGFFVDSSIAIRKFWENVEPFREDVKEIMRIVCKTQAKAENVQNFLPPGLLPEGKKEDGGSTTEKDATT
jgi:predicted metal-dependent hydrolase